MDQSLVFDPTEFTTEVTPDAVLKAVEKKDSLRALLIALRLRDESLIQHALLSVPKHWVSHLQALDSTYWAHANKCAC